MAHALRQAYGMTRTISGRITLNLVAGIVITVVTVVVAVFWMAARQDEQAGASTETMVVGGVDAMKRRAEALANDYGWWDDAYQAYVTEDAGVARHQCRLERHGDDGRRPVRDRLAGRQDRLRLGPR